MNYTVVMSQPSLPSPSSCQGRVLYPPLLSPGLSQALLILCGALGLVLVLRGALGLVLRRVLGLLLLRRALNLLRSPVLHLRGQAHRGYRADQRGCQAARRGCQGARRGCQAARQAVHHGRQAPQGGHQAPLRGCQGTQQCQQTHHQGHLYQ